ncbi:MAG: adenylosuccinate synthase [Candidatus Eisenbacteria bacterium]|uniref:Adenylosuccinate synthetase n=1 Tax=Eiseniibacteriota bacterium TaxID=2212470 RepID=A0A956NAK3_UNCEI|nr:adenylosuccinate synthase [Candidatus Eisenbacteria bacterium]MCB9464836.1 adenylosuccinate synthase [Candidatus Eisenbacteria bacterium]
MTVTVVVGCQWGDEGKGKIVDLMARRMDWVARYQGGANAGHTVVVGRQKYVLHLVPSGILHPKPKCIIGHGVVVDPAYLLEELDGLSTRDIALEGRLFLSEGAHAILPYHKWLETLDGQDVRVGTTKRGVGPAYQDKMGRTGIRMYELLDPKRLRRRIDEHAERVERAFRGAGIAPPQPIEAARTEWLATYSGLAHRLRGFVADTVALLAEARERGEKILCEGAQGTFLDVDLGTYPFVTSSTTTASGAAFGLGLPPSALTKVVGICKAYATRVGEGPFPTELHGEDGEALRSQGGEFGATTGRPRRVGWLDLVQLRQAVRINGVTSIVLTKLDVLSGRSSLEIATRYRADGELRSYTPTDVEALERCEPVYETVPGWEEPLDRIRRYADLPLTARRYIERIEDGCGAPIRTVSVGSGRNQIITVPSRAQR